MSLEVSKEKFYLDMSDVSKASKKVITGFSAATNKMSEDPISGLLGNV